MRIKLYRSTRFVGQVLYLSLVFVGIALAIGFRIPFGKQEPTASKDIFGERRFLSINKSLILHSSRTAVGVERHLVSLEGKGALGNAFLEFITANSYGTDFIHINIGTDAEFSIFTCYRSNLRHTISDYDVAAHAKQPATDTNSRFSTFGNNGTTANNDVSYITRMATADAGSAFTT